MDPKTPASREESSFLQLPQVQIIGAQKAGTSAIANWLFEHGGFCRPQKSHDEPSYYGKEVHFFDIDSRYHQGVDFYAKRFSGNKKSLDATPDTLAFADRVRYIYEVAGGNQVNTVKFLLILREPISRELSLYNHLAYDCRNLDVSERTGWHNQVLNADGSIMSFDEFVRDRSLPALLSHTEMTDGGYGRSTRHGMYYNHLSHWFQQFGRKQILVLSYHELVLSPNKVKDRICQFLEIDGGTSEFGHFNALNSSHKVTTVSRNSKEALADIFKPLNHKLYQLLIENPGPSMEQRPIIFPEP